MFRSRFGDPEALYGAIKGGSPSNGHSHMDAGSFIMEADGVRWALDLGMEEYDRLEGLHVKLWNRSQDSQRWRIFRLGPDSHNLLRFNGEQQRVQGRGDIVAYAGTGERRHVVLDLDSLYEGQVVRARRGFAFLDERALLIQDEWTAGATPVEAAFQWITDAVVQVDGSRITLTRNGKSLRLEILEPAGAEIEVVDTGTLLQWFDEPNPGVQRISIRTTTAVGIPGRFRVLAVPGSSGDYAAPVVRPLEEWGGECPN